MRRGHAAAAAVGRDELATGRQPGRPLCQPPCCQPAAVFRAPSPVSTLTADHIIPSGWLRLWADNAEFNLRHDWNSLLDAPAGVAPVTNRSTQRFPDAGVLADYLADFAAHQAAHQEGALSRGGYGTRGGWDSRGVGASRTSAGGRRHEAARRRETGRRGGVRRWGERVRVHATHRGWTVVRDASVRRRARDVSGVRVNPGGNTGAGTFERRIHLRESTNENKA